MKSTCIRNLILSAGLLLLAGTSNRLQAATFAWNVATGTAGWDTNGDWTTTGFPNAAGDVANLNKAISGTMTIPLGQGVTVGVLNMTGVANATYALGANGGNTITLNNSGAGATITLSPVGNNINNTIAAPLIMADSGGLTITANGGQSRTQLITGGITGTGNLTINDNRAGGTSAHFNITTGTINNIGTLTVNSAQSGAEAVAGLATILSSSIGANVTSFTKQGAAFLTISGANTYTGSTTITAGTLTLGVANAIPSSSSVSVASGAILNLNGKSDNIDGLSDAGTVDTTVAGTITLGIGNNNSGGTFSGVIQNTLGTLSLTKSGSGTETFSAAQTYSGATTINGGALVLSGSGALPSGSTISIGAGCSFDVSALGGTYTLGSGGLKASGTGTTVGTTAATIVPASGGIFDLNSQPVTLTWGGTASGTDSTHPALNVSQGTLNFGGNTITVNVPGTAIGVGTYTLVTAAAITGLPNLTPTFSGNGHAGGTSGSLSVVGNTLVLTVAVTGTVATWTANASGNWTDASKWTPNVPGALPGDAATLGVGSVLTTVTLDANKTLGLLTMTNNNSFIIASAGNTLTLDNSGSGAPITVTGGTANDIQTAVALNDNANIAVSSGKSLKISGVISATGAQAITASGAGTLTLSSTNTYSGGTTINAGTVAISTDGASAGDPGNLGAVPASATTNVVLNGGDLLATATLALNANRGIGIGPVGGTVGTNALIDAASGQTFTINGAITAAGNIGINNLTVNSLAPTPGTVGLGGTNTFNGTTVIANGTLELDSSLALQNSALIYNTGTLTFGNGIAAATLAGLSDTNSSQTIGLTNTTGGPVALTVGGNNAPINYGGNWSDGGLGGSLIKAGNGTLTLSNANYTGATTINIGSGTVTIYGSNLGSPSSPFTVGAQLFLLGGTATASAFNLGTVGGATGVGTTIGGTANLTNTSTTIGSSGNTAGNMTVNSSGNVNLGAVKVNRDNGGIGNGLIIAGGNVFATSINVGQSGVAARLADLNITGGTLMISDATQSGMFAIHCGAGNGFLTMSGGVLNYLGTDGLQMSVGAGPSVASISGGTANLAGITLNSGSAATTSTFTLDGASNPTLYLGSAGLVINAPSATVAAIFGNGTIGALADWSSSAPITLTNSPTFQAADASSGAHNITLSGVLSGAAGLTKTGNGILTLGGANTYSGATTVSNGTLVVNGSTAGSGVDVRANTTLGGSGTIGDPTVTIENAGHTLPGGFLGNSAGVTNTMNGNLTYNAGAEADFNAGTVYNSGHDKIIVNGTLSGNNINVGVNFTGGIGMDTSGYYTLFQLNGAHPATFNPTPIWLGTPPANSNLFSVAVLGNTVVLSGSPIQVTSATATPNPAGHNQTVTFAVNVTAGSYTINPSTGISLDTGSLGGSIFLVQSNGTSVYTNSIVLPSNPTFGQYALNYTVTDSNADTINSQISLTIGGAAEVWNGNASPDNTWGNPLNWADGSAPLTGDLVTFAGTHQLTPNMETSYSIGSLTFDSTAGSFNITNNGIGTLTLSGSATNNSANAQTLSVPVSLTGEPTFNTAAGNIVISNVVSDDGTGFIKTGTNTLKLAGNNTYSGPITINSGTLSLDGDNSSASSSYLTNNATLRLANANAVVASVLTLNNGSSLKLRADAGTTFNVGSLAFQNATNTLNFDVSNVTVGVTGQTLSLNAPLTFPTNFDQTINVTGNNTYTLALGDVALASTSHLPYFNFNVNTLPTGAGVTINSITAGNFGNDVNMNGGGKITVIGNLSNISNSSINLFVNNGTIVTLQGQTVKAGTGDGYKYDVVNGTLVLDNSQALINNTTSAGLDQSVFILGAATNVISGATYPHAAGVLTATNNNFNAAVYLGDGNNPSGGLTTPANLTNNVSDGDVGFTNSGVFTIGGQNTSGVNTYANPIILGWTANRGKSVTLIAATGGEVDFADILANGTDQSAGVTVNDVTHQGLVKFTGVNTYRGNTIVNGGTLDVANANFSTNSTVSVANGATLQLDFVTTNIIAGLILNGVSKPGGVYNSGNTPTFFAGSGSLQVVLAGPIAPTNSPTITSFSLSGNNIVIAGNNGDTGATYYILDSTNVAKPLAQWKTVATNAANGSAFTFTGTNVVTPGAGQQFYILSSTNYNP